MYDIDNENEDRKQNTVNVSIPGMTQAVRDALLDPSKEIVRDNMGEVIEIRTRPSTPLQRARNFASTMNLKEVRRALAVAQRNVAMGIKGDWAIHVQALNERRVELTHQRQRDLISRSTAFGTARSRARRDQKEGK